MGWRFEIDIDSGTELEGWFGDMYGTGYIERGFSDFFSTVRVRSADPGGGRTIGREGRDI